jgi:hypothetical protein
MRPLMLEQLIWVAAAVVVGLVELVARVVAVS